MSELIVDDVIDVFEVEGNTDGTEGRGNKTIIAICSHQPTAMRLGKGNYVQGCNCPINRKKAFKMGEQWYVPGIIVRPDTDDMKLEARIEEKKALIKRLEESGLSEKDLTTLKERL